MAKARRLTAREIAAYTLLGEAGGEGDEGMAAVMHVIKNRAESGSYPSSYAAVALQRSKTGTYQFTTWSKKYGNNPTGRYKRNSPEFKRALNIVDAVLNGAIPDPTGGALNYYASDGINAIAEPDWFQAVATADSVQIGNHLFAAKNAVRPDPVEYANKVKAAAEGAPTPRPRPLGVSTGSRVDENNILPMPVGTGLIERKVQTVAIDPYTNQPIARNPVTGTAQAGGTKAEGSAALKGVSTPRQQLRDAAPTPKAPITRPPLVPVVGPAPPSVEMGEEQRDTSGRQAPGGSGSQQTTTIVVRPDGTEKKQQQSATTALPAGTRPASIGAGAGISTKPTSQSQPPVLVAKKVMVLNPAYNSAAVSEAETRNEIRMMRGLDGKLVAGGSVNAGKTGAQGSAIPKYIEKTIYVEQAPRGTGGGGGSEPYYPPTVQIATGKQVPVGTRHTVGKYTFEVQADGSIKNLTTGSTSAPAPKPKAPENRWEGVLDQFGMII